MSLDDGNRKTSIEIYFQITLETKIANSAIVL
jgi:hypothetical protein